MDDLPALYPATVWIGRFGAHLMAQLPALEVVDAVKRAVAIWPYASHLEPEAAADLMQARLARHRSRQRRREVLSALLGSGESA